MRSFDTELREAINEATENSGLITAAKNAYSKFLKSANLVLQALAKEIKSKERERYKRPALRMNISDGTLSISWKFKKVVNCSMDLLTSQWVIETAGGRKFISDKGNNFDLRDDMTLLADAIVTAFAKHYKSLGGEDGK